MEDSKPSESSAVLLPIVPFAWLLGDFTVAKYLKLVVLMVVLCPLLWLSSGSFSGNATATSADPPQGAKPVAVGDDAGNYMIISTLEVGYRGLQVVGDLN